MRAADSSSRPAGDYLPAAGPLQGPVARSFSLAAAGAIAAAVAVYPRFVASGMHDVPHGALVLLMWGVAAGFVHGVGFTPRGSMLRFWLGPLAAWVLMAFGLAFLLVAR